jgi:hypothetical protein
MEGVVTAFAEGNQIGWRIAAAADAEPDVVDVQLVTVLDAFLAGLAAYPYRIRACLRLNCVGERIQKTLL